jgi:hypothetical protein
MHELRRFVPRQFADWSGAYLIEEDPQHHWRDCRVVDISSAGAGLELLDPPPEIPAGGRILVAVRWHAEIRNSGPNKGDRRRVGTRFVDLTDAERSYLESQERLAVHW